MWEILFFTFMAGVLVGSVAMAYVFHHATLGGSATEGTE